MQFTLIASAIAGAAGFALAWQLQAGNITKHELTYATERIAVQDSIRTALEANQRQVAAAQADAVLRNRTLRRESDASRAAAVSLRQSSDSAVRAAGTDAATCAHVVTAYGIVFAECTGTLQEVARDADQCQSDLKLMQESWPK